jgi:alcohol dehydrogenase class IV
VPGEPRTTDVELGVELGQSEDCDVVIGYGGGSAIDAAKAIAAMLGNPGDLFDHLEVVGRGLPLNRPALPCLAIATTAGTGAEVTRNSVLSSPQHQVKASLRSPCLLPKVALVDPELTFPLPPLLTACTGLDALTQLIEPFVCSRANPLVDALCLDGMARVAKSLRRACAAGFDLAAREDMSLASLFGGLALANAGLGAVHGFAAPIGGTCPAPHGAVCAALLPHVFLANVRALSDRAPGSPTLTKYDQVARVLTGNPRSTPDEAAAWLLQLSKDLGVPGLRAYGLSEAAVAGVVAKAGQASSMKANPISLETSELETILQAAL